MNSTATDRYDVIVVGARCAGAATALLLSRAGLRVLAVEQAARGSDTLSTHALMRAGVLQLHRWGLLPRLIEAGTPAITKTHFDYGTEQSTVTIRSAFGVNALYAPRRTVLDVALQDAAGEAGADVAFGVTVTGLKRDRNGAVCGVIGHDRRRRPFAADAPLTVGADGYRSTIAALVKAPVQRRGSAAAGAWCTHVEGLQQDGYRWFYRPGAAAGFIPTNGGVTCVFAGMPGEGFAGSRRSTPWESLCESFQAAAPFAVEELRAAEPVAPIRGWAGAPSFTRRPYGSGWALVGDAGYFTDPLGTHGMTQAFRDAQLLSRAVLEASSAGSSLEPSLAEYGRIRDRLSSSLFTATEGLASYRWDVSGAQRLLRQLAAGFTSEVELLAELALKDAAAAL